MSRFLLGLFLLTALSFGAQPAFPQDEAQSEGNPVLESYKAFSEELPPAEKRHFNVIYSNHNIIQIVETVQNSVTRAVKACGKENPDMKDPLNKRLAEWDAAIKPIMKDAAANVKNMILAQEYAEEKEIRALLKTIDKAREQEEKRADKVPVTTPEACNHLLAKMDETQGTFTQLLEGTLLSLPMSLQREQQEEAKAQSESE